jgi:hypothetical protein
VTSGDQCSSPRQLQRVVLGRQDLPAVVGKVGRREMIIVSVSQSVKLGGSHWLLSER